MAMYVYKKEVINFFMSPYIIHFLGAVVSSFMLENLYIILVYLFYNVY